MEYKEVFSTANKIRRTLEHIELPDVFLNTRCLSRFPSGCCKISSTILMHYFASYHGVANESMTLFANAKIPGGTHAWAKIFSWHVDITADQFGREPVIVTLQTPWTDCIEGPDEYQFQGVAVDFKDEIDIVCEGINRA